MKENGQEANVYSMMKRPIPRKRIGIVHLKMVKENRCLYGTKRFRTSAEAVDMIKPVLEAADREIVVVLSLNVKLEPMAAEIVAVGGLNQCSVDMGNVFKHAILNNAAYIICFHNHPTGNPDPSEEDKRLTLRMERCGVLLGIRLVDHIILGDEDRYFSFLEQNLMTYPEREEVWGCAVAGN